ncbi:MAG: two-component system sensor histidine kinase PhoQ [Enterobacteriaceae bacterium]
MKSQQNSRWSFPPLSLRARFLFGTATVVLAMTLAYGILAIGGYLVSFDRTTYQLLRAESNLFFNLAHWQDNTLSINIPKGIELNYPTLVFIYDQQQKLLWSQRRLPPLEQQINPAWLKKSGLYEIDTSKEISSLILANRLDQGSSVHQQELQKQLQQYKDDSDDAMTHSVAVNTYPATPSLPALTIVVIDIVPQELQMTGTVWMWFGYLLLANLVLVVPLLWLAAYWSLRPIKKLAEQVRELEYGQRELLDQLPPHELRSLVLNLNTLLQSERKRYEKYRTTLSDLTHSLKTPLAVLQSTLRSMRSRQQSIAEAEPIMLEQISRISQQVGYYLHRATIRNEHYTVGREVHSVAALLDSLCSALSKVYRHKGVDIQLNVPAELVFIGDKNDFMEVLGNLLDNACKYCLEFIQVTATLKEDQLWILIDDDGPGIAVAQRERIFIRGQRADTLQPGQGLGLSSAREIVEQYQGSITILDSPLGGACIQVCFRQDK